MSAMDFEYAIRKDVRNNPIIREVDQERQRQLLKTAAIGAVLVLVVLFSVLQNFEVLRHGYGIQQLQQQRAEEEAWNRRLRLEVEMLRAPARIEREALELGLVPPAGAQFVVIERVAEPAAPAKAVVAAR